MMRMIRPRSLGLAALAAAPLALAACGTTVPEGVTVDTTVDYQAPPRDVIHIELKNESHTIYVDRRTGAASLAERQRLDAFVTTFGADRPEAIHAELHGGGSGEELRSVANLMVELGVMRSKIKLFPGERSTVQAPSGTDAVVIAGTRAVAVLPNCPGWLNHVAAPADNMVEPKFGCTDVSNFAAQVADPYDLIAGESSTYSEGQPAADAVAAYRTDKVKELPKSGEFSVIGGGK
jgi:pilus biogenesis lipoprotein CpaD